MQIIIRAFLQNDRRRGILRSGPLDQNQSGTVRGGTMAREARTSLELAESVTPGTDMGKAREARGAQDELEGGV